ncbi:hypothetical protein FB451DRAFT_1369761 [Mycena latifolia]|nr:hypothetical protein FB451DRAFT_1369761 [Mycena latifolia]
MSSSAIPHVIAFLTRPLLSSFPAVTVTSAQLILTASLSSAPAMSTFALTASTPPAPILAAVLGAGISWSAWFAALAGGRDTVLLFYGPGFVKVRVGDASVTDVWSEDAQGSIVRISQPLSLLQQSTGARLRATLLSARVRSMRREQQAIHTPTLLEVSSSDSESDSDSDSDSGRSASSKFSASSTESLTSAGSSPTCSPPKPACVALPTATAPAPALYRAPRPTHSSRAPKTTSPRALKPQARAAPVSTAKKDLTAYLYQGGVTRVMSGGVMLGARS